MANSAASSAPGSSNATFTTIAATVGCYCDCSYCYYWSLLMTNSCGKTTVNRLRLHPVGLISVTILIFRTLTTQSQMFSWYKFDIKMLMRRYLLFSIIQILNKRTSTVQKTDWDVSTTATDKFILLCPALLIIHHEYKGRDVLLGTLLRPFILHYAYSCIKLNKRLKDFAPNC